MLDGNNGGYANDWLLGDNKTGEIAQFELGLKAHRVWRTKDGVFVGSNFARDPAVIAKDTTFDPHNPATSPNARRTCWDAIDGTEQGKDRRRPWRKNSWPIITTRSRSEMTPMSAHCARTLRIRRAAWKFGVGLRTTLAAR